MDPRDGAREGEVTAFTVETSSYLLASVTEFLWKRELYPKSGYLRLCSWQYSALSGSGPVRVASGTLMCERVSEAGPGRGRSRHDVGAAHAVWVQYTGQLTHVASGEVLERHATGRAGAQPLQSHLSQSLASDTPQAGRSQWLRVVSGDGGSSPPPGLKWASEQSRHRLRVLLFCRFCLPWMTRNGN